jgi:hypothetical protein
MGQTFRWEYPNNPPSKVPFTQEIPCGCFLKAGIPAFLKADIPAAVEMTSM